MLRHCAHLILSQRDKYSAGWKRKEKGERGHTEQERQNRRGRSKQKEQERAVGLEREGETERVIFSCMQPCVVYII